MFVDLSNATESSGQRVISIGNLTDLENDVILVEFSNVPSFMNSSFSDSGELALTVDEARASNGVFTVPYEV